LSCPQLVFYEIYSPAKGAEEEEEEDAWDWAKQPPLNSKSILVLLTWEGMVPPLPPGFQISAVSSISTDHAASSVVVLLATHQQADDVMMALLKEVHFLFANGMFRFFFINYFQFSVMTPSPCMNQRKPRLNPILKLKIFSITNL
jgi:hypothetical protein